MNSNADTPPETPIIEGHYVNFFKIGYNRDVFVIDHYQYFPENREENQTGRMPTDPKLRLITSPTDARQLLENLRSAIETYDAAYVNSRDSQFEE